jgi:hypothetical protein
MWAQKFPGVTLENFLACRADGTGNSIYRYMSTIRDVHNISFSGPIDDLLRLGLIEPDMVSVKPKRKLFRCGPDVKGVDDFYSVRRAGGVLKITRELDETLPRSHPLSPFSVWNWPIESDVERREALPEYVETASKMARTGARLYVETIAECTSAEESNLWQRILPSIQFFEYQLKGLLDEAQRTPKAFALRLVVDNTRTP